MAGSRTPLREFIRSSPHDDRANYTEVLRVPSMSAGVYVLPAGTPDPQSPHGEDEVYYVAAGRGRLRVEDLELPAEPGDLLFVPAGVDHRFEAIEERLVLLAVFGPAEGTRTPKGAGPGTG